MFHCPEKVGHIHNVEYNWNFLVRMHLSNIAECFLLGGSVWKSKSSDYHLLVTLHKFLLGISKDNLFPRDNLSGYNVPVRSEGGFCWFYHFCISGLRSARGQWRFIAVQSVSELLASGSAITGLTNPKSNRSYWRSTSPTTMVWCLQHYCVLSSAEVS